MTLDDRSNHSGYVSSQERGTIDQVLARWKEHFEEHLNEGSELEQPTRPVDLRDDGVDIDLPSRGEIEGALKYLQKYKTDSITAEFLKNGEPNLVDALPEMIQQAWTSETSRAINSIVKTIEGFAS
jgi:hypothetical protein